MKWVRTTSEHGYTNLPKLCGPPENLRFQQGDKKHVTCWGPTSIRHHRTKFSYSNNWGPRICAPLHHNIYFYWMCMILKNIFDLWLNCNESLNDAHIIKIYTIWVSNSPKCNWLDSHWTREHAALTVTVKSCNGTRKWCMCRTYISCVLNIANNWSLKLFPPKNVGLPQQNIVDKKALK